MVVIINTSLVIVKLSAVIILYSILDHYVHRNSSFGHGHGPGHGDYYSSYDSSSSYETSSSSYDDDHFTLKHRLVRWIP